MSVGHGWLGDCAVVSDRRSCADAGGLRIWTAGEEEGRGLEDGLSHTVAAVGRHSFDLLVQCMAAADSDGDHRAVVDIAELAGAAVLGPVEQSCKAVSWTAVAPLYSQSCRCERRDCP